jgi:hypothetical protein
VSGGWEDSNCCYHHEVVFRFLNIGAIGIISISISIIIIISVSMVAASS